MAATAHALAAFSQASAEGAAELTARRVLAWLEHAKPQWMADPGQALLTSCYRGKAAVCLLDETTVDMATTDLLLALERADEIPVAAGKRWTLGPLPLAQALSLLTQSPHRADAARRADSIPGELQRLFDHARARQSETPMSLAEWAEVAALPVPSGLAQDVWSWLCAQQLPSGAFPDTTASDFVYSRGTGKIFEVLALGPDDGGAVERAGRWLLAMQYRADSMFFIPTEHRALVLGGLRHDPFNADAWIDAAAHLLLGLARLPRE